MTLELEPPLPPGEPPAPGTVATSGEGIEVLKSEVRRRFGCESVDLKRARWWTERQRRELATRGT